jgi:predicted nucleotidyltransferase component of viral defense system
MNLSNYNKAYLGRKAKKLGFIRETLEKVLRLADILEYFNTNPLLRESLALKGGTAINLTIFNLPRLSVDIDLDYLKTNSRDEMLKNREKINTVIDRFMDSQGYKKSPKSKTPYSLDSWVYKYTNAGGNLDNIKIEINYSLRSHILCAEERSIVTEYFSSDYKIKSLDPIEIYASKINALLNRAAARDLYDIRNMIKFGLFDEKEKIILKKGVIFYAAISSKKINKKLDTNVIDSITKHKIRTDLLPVIGSNDDFNLNVSKKIVKEYINNLMILQKNENEFLERFEKKEYAPELLFNDQEILARIKAHPMALWKTKYRK